MLYWAEDERTRSVTQFIDQPEPGQWKGEFTLKMDV